MFTSSNGTKVGKVIQKNISKCHDSELSREVMMQTTGTKLSQTHSHVLAINLILVIHCMQISGAAAMASDKEPYGYPYEVHVYTGFRSRAQTQSKVHMTFAGDNSKSETIQLDNKYNTEVRKNCSQTIIGNYSI